MEVVTVAAVDGDVDMELGDEDECHFGIIVADDINVEQICAEVIAIVVQEDSCNSLVQSEDNRSFMRRLVLIKESLGGTAELYSSMIETIKSNLLMGSEKLQKELEFIKLHVVAYLNENPGKLISIGLKNDLINTLTSMEVKVFTAAKRPFDIVKMRAGVSRRVRRHLRISGLPSKYEGSHGADICQISMVALDAHIDNQDGWGDGWYPPTEMANVKEYILQLKNFLRIGPAEDGSYVWQMLQPFHVLLPGFILILFGKLVAFTPVEIPEFLETFLFKVRSGNPLSKDKHSQRNVYINTQEIHPLLAGSHSIIARGMMPNTSEIIQQPRQNRFCYVGTPLNNVGMSVFEFGSEYGSENVQCVFANPGIAHPFTRSSAHPVEVYATAGSHGIAGALAAKVREGRKSTTVHNVKAASHGKAVLRKRSAKGGGGKASSESVTGVEEEESEGEEGVDEDVLSLAEWTIRNKGFVFISSDHKFYKVATTSAISNRQIVENYGVAEFGKGVQNIEKGSCELRHPLYPLDHGFSSESISCVSGGRFSIVYFVSGPRDLEFKILHSRPTFSHIGKVDDTCSQAEMKDASNDIRVVNRCESVIAKKGEFLYFDPTTMVKVSVACGSRQLSVDCQAVEIFSISFGSQVFPRSGSFQHAAYPSCLAAKSTRFADQILRKSRDPIFEALLLSHLFQFPSVVDFWLPCFPPSKKKDKIDLELALTIVSNPPLCDSWKETDDLRHLILLRSGFIKNALLSSLSVWTLINWIQLASSNPNVLFNEVICLNHALKTRTLPDQTALLAACALLAQSFPREIPSFDRVTTRREMMSVLEQFGGGDEDAEFNPQTMIRSMLSTHPETLNFTFIHKNDWSGFPVNDLRRVTERDATPPQKCNCENTCISGVCITCDSENWCSKINCSLTARGKDCSNNPLLFKPLPVRVGYSGHPLLKNALYVEEACQPGRYIVEYTGEINYAIAGDAQDGSDYVFVVDCSKIYGYSKSRLGIDARRKGSPARFVNHSHGPTCIPVTRFLDGKVVIWFQSISWLYAMMEVTFDYGDAFIIPVCLCQSKHCPGSNGRGGGYSGAEGSDKLTRRGSGVNTKAPSSRIPPPQTSKSPGLVQKSPVPIEERSPAPVPKSPGLVQKSPGPIEERSPAPVLTSPSRPNLRGMSDDVRDKRVVQPLPQGALAEEVIAATPVSPSSRRRKRPESPVATTIPISSKGSKAAKDATENKECDEGGSRRSPRHK